jgi:hypothetical protein
MVFIGSGVLSRLLTAAERCLGPSGESLLRTTALQTLTKPVEHLTFAELPVLLNAFDHTLRVQVGNEVARGLAATLDRLQSEIDAGLSTRLIGALFKRVGSVAEPLLRTTCTSLGYQLETVHASQLRVLAETLQASTVALLGREMADSLHAAVMDAEHRRPASVTKQLFEVARQHLGDNTEMIMSQLCREHLETEVDELDAGSVRALARAVEQYGPTVIGATFATQFAGETASLLVSPAEPLRRRVVQMTRDVVGPFAPQFLDEVCAAHGLPFTAVDYEHLMWLAEVLRTETAPLAGKVAADGLSRQLRAVLTGKR